VAVVPMECHGDKGLAATAELAQGWRMNPWDRFVVPTLIRLACSQGEIMKRRALVVPGARGRTLELGCGGGINLPLYDPELVPALVGIDPHPSLARTTREKARDLPLAVRVHEGLAERLPFSDASFDTVVTTFTLCSVRDQGESLAEARRVLKPDGRLLFLEHGLSPDADVARTQHRVEPVWKRIAGGCHLTRPVSAGIEAAGFRVVERDQGYARRTPRFAGWMEWGVAMRDEIRRS
jgi:SAM-dependent methyltransferase